LLLTLPLLVVDQLLRAAFQLLGGRLLVVTWLLLLLLRIFLLL